MPEFFVWYDNQSDPSGVPFWEGAGWVEAENAQKAAQQAKADGCQWTTVCITASTDTPTEKTILAQA